MEEEGPGVSSSGDTYDCTVADVTDVFHVEEKTGMEDEIEIPPLTRTDSVCLTKEMLGYKSDLSLSTIASSEDEYVPASSEASSDESSEQSSQKRRPKTSSESKGGSAGLSGAKKKKRGRGASVHSREEDSDESRLETKKRYNRSDKRGSRLSEEEGSGESILKTKRRYKNSEKRGTISPVEGEPDDSASIKRKKSRKTYSRHEKTTASISVKTSDSLVIADVPKVDGCKKYHQKRNYCLYCRKPQTKIARHLERKHRDKSEVASAMMYAKKSKERRNRLDLLRKQGNRAHNIDTLTKGEGTLVPCKQLSDGKSSSKDYQHCFACFGYFKRKFLLKHAKRCSLAQSVYRTLPGKTRIQALCASAQPVPKDVNVKVWALVNGMTQDEITHAVKEDIYIMKVGEKMYNRQLETASQHDNVCQMMRGLGRLLIRGRTVTPLKTMEDYINPQLFHHVIRAVKEVAGFDEKKNKFEKPTLATELGQSIQRVADIMEAEALSSLNKEKNQVVQEFRRMYSLTWNEMISSAAYCTLEEKKWNKPKLIPLAEDVKKMHMYMTDKQKQYYRQLLDKKISRNWSNLAKVILAQIILFNRRRESEVSKMRLDAFITRDNSPFNEDIGEALTVLEKKLCQHFQRVEIRGKRGGKVPLILTPTMVQSLELLVEERSSCGIGENIYLFARPGFETRLRGSDCIRELAENCGAEKPEALSSTKLRRQVATLSGVLRLIDAEQDLLADFLGHRMSYRLPEGTLLAKISKVLMACEQGRLAEFKGKSLDQISISPNDQSEVMEESSGESSEDEDHPAAPAGEEPVARGKKGTSKQQLGQKRGSGGAKKAIRKWSTEEVKAVEKSLMDFICMGKTPGKQDCERCIAASPEVLAHRDWKGVKFYVYNRIR
ncbi:uncharacterized protein LOC142991389 isoform X2 [Genypterus blacodes]|uniref:uncharacterized protein LOC142991389 isoform X2 n=1 Tax=Genypterus blacodes TaxID=154954 RepID=UPI003F7725DE